jgi:hypothetical protein
MLYLFSDFFNGSFFFLLSHSVYFVIVLVLYLKFKKYSLIIFVFSVALENISFI